MLFFVIRHSKLTYKHIKVGICIREIIIGRRYKRSQVIICTDFYLTYHYIIIFRINSCNIFIIRKCSNCCRNTESCITVCHFVCYINLFRTVTVCQNFKLQNLFLRTDMAYIFSVIVQTPFIIAQMLCCQNFIRLKFCTCVIIEN